MENLHAYWRINYIEAPKEEKESRNPFLEIPKTKDDKTSLLLYRGTHSFIVLNKFPYNAGHLLVLPYREVPNLKDLNPEERMDLFDNIMKGQAILEEALNPDGFNVGFNLGSAAGAGIPSHLHCHIVPRWDGDTNFMPVLGKTRVLPLALEQMWERLRSFI